MRWPHPRPGSGKTVSTTVPEHARPSALELGTVFGVLSLHLWTLSISPTFWHDEAQLVDYGRATWFERATDWSLNMIPGGKVVHPFCYLGVGLQEAFYRMFSPSWLGPRVAALLGAGVAAVALLHWLAKRGLGRAERLGIAALFLVDPLITQSYRGARVDCWALAAMFTALWLVDRAAKPSRAQLSAAGALCVSAVFVWPTALLVSPLVAWAMSRSDRQRSRAEWTQACVWAAAGAISCAAVLLAGFWTLHPPELAGTSAILAAQLDPPGRALQEGIEVLRALYPRLLVTWVLAAACALMAPRARALVWLTLGVLGVLLLTRFYGARALYLMPYFCALMAEALHARAQGRAFRVLRMGLFASVLACATFSLGLRSLSALEQQAGRDSRRLERWAEQAIGPGAHRVFIEPFEFYFVGRALGWHMVQSFPQGSAYADELAESADFAILLEDQPLRPGFFVVAHLPLPAPPSGALARLAGARPYGGYVIAARTAPSSK